MLRKLTLVSALAASGFAMNANAVDYDLFLGGATALDTATRRLIVIDVCASSIEKYSSPAGFTYRCTPKAGLAGINPATDRVVISKNTLAGSFSSIREVRNQASLARPAIPGTAGCPASGTAATEFGINITTFACTTNAANAIPDGGFSDVEPALFDSPIPVTPTGPAPLGASWKNGLTSVAAFSAAFGFPVNDKAYRILQAAQGIFPSVAAATAGDPTFSAANAPSINLADARGMFAGSLTDWNGVSSNVATHAGTTATSVKVCARLNTSGTFATFNALMQGNPCTGSAAAPFKDNTQDDCSVNGGTVGTGTGINNGGYIGDGSYPNVTADQCRGVYTQVKNSGAGQVDTCLTKADDLDEMAIGVLGLDRIPGDVGSGTGDDPDGATDKWHFVKFGGIYPANSTIINGGYDFVAEANFNRRAPGNGPAYGTQKTALLDKIQNSSADPLNPLAGVFSLPSRGFTFDGVAPVIKAERGGNTCSPLLTTF